MNDHIDSLSVSMCADTCSSKYSDDFIRACVASLSSETTDPQRNGLSVLDLVSNVYGVSVNEIPGHIGSWTAI